MVIEKAIHTGSQAMALLAMLNEELTYRLQLRFRYEAVGYQLKLDAWQDDLSFVTAPQWITLTGGPQLLTIELVGSTGPGVDDGRARLWVDGALAAEITGLDNDQLALRRVRFGGISVKAGMTGTLKLDSYSSFLATP